ncbi:helix-turn-helix domain-containing protein [Roseibium sp.]|uniref:helix-turn-helix domain-containing protein n=1 Tax=Roseibium sp. TaxID=1936156 RepID=UPI003D0B373A
MTGNIIDTRRGQRLGIALRQRGQRKAMALAAELNISPAAVSKWRRGHPMSVDNACRIAVALDISLDWLLMGRNAPEWLQREQLAATEIDLIENLRVRPRHLGRLFIELLATIPPLPASPTGPATKSTDG